jgi:hypothetical protein
MNIQEYIESGILEMYVLGAATDAESEELLYYKEQYPEVKTALSELELDMERVAKQMAIMPPPGTWDKIEDQINELATIREIEPFKFRQYSDNKRADDNSRNGFIDIESENTHIRIHKTWKLVFAAVFVLSKIFLGCAIYFYLENRQAQQQIQELKTELRTHKISY